MKEYNEQELNEMDVKEIGIVLSMHGVTGEYRKRVQEIYLRKRQELRTK